MNEAGQRQYLVVEDVPEIREWLVATVAEEFGSVAAASASLSEARAWLSTHRRRGASLLALIDLGLPDGDGRDLIAELAASDPAAVMVVTTIFEDDESLIGALSAGAHGYLLKDRDSAEFGRRLRSIDTGEVPITPAIARRLLTRFREDGGQRTHLTPRESEVLRLVGRGMTVQETGQLLGMSAQTAATHVKTIYRKLEIGSRAEAALEARRRGLA